MVHRSSARHGMCGASRGKSLIEGSVVFLEQLGNKLKETVGLCGSQKGKPFILCLLHEDGLWVCASD